MGSELKPFRPYIDPLMRCPGGRTRERNNLWVDSCFDLEVFDIFLLNVTFPPQFEFTRRNRCPVKLFLCAAVRDQLLCVFFLRP